MSFADMMTLLFCLFMVLFAISSVNTSKFEALQRSLQDAFSGAVLSGGKAVMASGSSEGTQKAAPQPPLPSLRPLTAMNDTSAQSAAEREAKARQEEQDFRALKRRVDSPRRGRRPAGQGQGDRASPRPGHPAAHRQGLLRFRRGDAQADRTQAGRQDRRHRARASASTRSSSKATRTRSRSPAPSTPPTGSCPAPAPARSSAISSTTASCARRVSLSGFSSQEPIASNSTPEGRAQNRRVEVVLSRIHTDTES